VLKNNGITQKEPFAWRLAQSSKGTLYVVIARRSENGSIGNEGDGALTIDRRSEHWQTVPLPEGTNGPNGLAVDPQSPSSRAPGSSSSRRRQDDRRLRIDGEPVGPIRSLRQRNSLPVFGSVGRSVKSAIAFHCRCCHSPIVARSRRRVCPSNFAQPPRERFFLSNPIVLQHPDTSAV